VNTFLCYFRGPSGGSGHAGQDDGQLAERLQDQEGNVPHGGTALQGVSDQTDDHAAQHTAQLRQVHHPQPREEGKEKHSLFYILDHMCAFILKVSNSGHVILCGP